MSYNTICIRPVRLPIGRVMIPRTRTTVVMATQQIASSGDQGPAGKAKNIAATLRNKLSGAW